MVNGEILFGTDCTRHLLILHKKFIYNHYLGISGLVTSGICHLIEGTKVSYAFHGTLLIFAYKGLVKSL